MERRIFPKPVKKMKPVIWVIFLVVLLAALIWWYNFSHPNKSKEIISSSPVRLTYYVAKGGTNEIRGLVVKKLEIDKKYGLDIDFQTADPGELERRILNREINLAEVSPFIVGSAYQKNVPLKIISPAIRFTYQVVVPKTSHVKSLDDLKRKKVGLAPKVTAAFSATRISLKSLGIDPENDFDVLFGNIPQTAEALERGDVDAAVMAYPSAGPILASGRFRILANLGEIWSERENGLPMPFVVVMANDEWLTQNGDTARRLVLTLLEGSRTIQDDPRVISSLIDYLKSNNYISPDVVRSLEANVPEQLFNAYGDKELQAFNLFFQRAKEYGVLPKDFPSPKAFLIAPQSLGI